MNTLANKKETQYLVGESHQKSIVAIIVLLWCICVQFEQFFG